MKIHDKAAWHIDAGEDEREVIQKFEVVFAVLKSKQMLTEEGKEIVEVGVDESVSLHDRLLTAEGKIFIEENYDSVINLKSNEIAVKLLDL